MASSTSGTVSSGSDGDLMDLRKRKRMQSNRESARRSRIRKQNLVEDLTAQVGRLRKDNAQILTDINTTASRFAAVEAANQILRAQASELRQRLHSLDQILSFVDNNVSGFEEFDEMDCAFNSFVVGGFMNQPIMASADLFQY